MSSHNRIKPNESSFKTFDHGATSGAYGHQDRRPSQNKVKPNEASSKYLGRDEDYMKPAKTYSSSPVKPNISSFTVTERYMPRGYLNAERTRPPMNQVKPNHASGNYNKRHESKSLADAYDSQDEVSGSEPDEEENNTDWWRRPPLSGKVNTNKTSFGTMYSP